jgi:hypothetical protein
MTPSSRALDAFPEPVRLREITRALGLLEEIVCDDWESQTYAFDPEWGEGEQMASMRDGSGNEWFLLFAPAGLVLLGFDHEASPMSPYTRADRSLWPGLLDGFPELLTPALSEPAFSPGDHTFCIWRAADDVRYRIGNVVFPQRDAVEPFRGDPDGSAHLLRILADDPALYVEHARQQHDVELDLAAVARIHAEQRVDAATLRALREDVDVGAFLARARAMGFAVS